MVNGKLTDVPDSIRTSWNAWCQHAFCYNHPVHEKAITRIMDIVGLPRRCMAKAYCTMECTIECPMECTCWPPAAPHDQSVGVAGLGQAWRDGPPLRAPMGFCLVRPWGSCVPREWP